MSDERIVVARLLGQVVADLDGRGYPRVGVVRQAARLLLEVPEEAAERCAGCGGELVQPATGRRRKWCSERCRRRRRP